MEQSISFASEIQKMLCLGKTGRQRGKASRFSGFEKDKYAERFGRTGLYFESG